jgi:hypothetical protein
MTSNLFIKKRMIHSPINYYMKLKILNLKFHNLSGFQSHEFFGNDGKILNYVFDNLNCFHSHYVVDIDDYEENHLFYWEIIDDPVLPYIIGITPEYYKEVVSKDNKGYITLHYYWNKNGVENWYLHFFSASGRC